jgi:hypothetical protein
MLNAGFQNKRKSLSPQPERASSKILKNVPKPNGIDLANRRLLELLP